MRVVIEPQVEDSNARKLRMGPNQQVRVGGTAWAEFAVPDPQLAEIHFILETDQDKCVVRENAKGKGVYVNGVRVHEAILKHGDDLFAGSTHFRVALEDTADGTSRIGKRTAAEVELAQSSAPRLRPDAPATKRSTSEPKHDRRFAGRMCKSGLACFQELRLLPSEVAGRLSKSAPAFVVVNTARVEPPLAAQFDQSASLVSADQTARGSAFSVRLQPIENATQLAQIDSLWGRDAAIIAFSRQPMADLAAALKRHVTWFVAPSVLRTQLDQADRKFVSNLVGLFDAVLIESQGGADWLVYSRADKSSAWVSAGFPATITL